MSSKKKQSKATDYNGTWWDKELLDLGAFSLCLRQICLIFLAGLLFMAPYFRGLFFYQELLYFHLFYAFLFGLASWFVTFVLKEKLLQTYLDWAVFALVLVYLVSTLLSPANLREAIGETMKYANYFIVFWLSSRLVKRDGELKLFLGTLVITGVGVTLSGIGTALGTFEVNGAWVNGRLNSTLQYPNTLAAYLMALQAVALYLWASPGRYGAKVLWGAANVIFVASIIMTLSRGAWILYPAILALLIIGLPGRYRWVTLGKLLLAGTMGVALAGQLFKAIGAGGGAKGWLTLLVFIGLLAAIQWLISRYASLVEDDPKRLKLVALALGVLLAFLVGAGAFALTQPESALGSLVPQQVLDRINTIDLTTHSAAERIFFYQDALKIIKDYPILGLGGGGWEAIYPQYQGHLYFTSEVHNHFLQVGVETGFLGLALFVTIWLLLLYSGVRIYILKELAEEKARVWAVTVAALALVMHSGLDFNLSLAAVSMLLWALAGLVNQQALTLDKPADLYFNPSLKPGANLGIGLAISLALLALSLTQLSAESNFQRGVALVQAGHNQGALDMERALALMPYNARFSAILGEMYFNTAQAIEDQESSREFLNKALGHLEQAHRHDRYNFQHLVTLAQIKLHLDQRAAGVAAMERAVQYYPLNLQLYNRLGQIYLEAIRQEEGLGNREQALDYLSRLERIPVQMAWVMDQSPEERARAWRGPKLQQTNDLKLYLAEGYIVMGEGHRAKELLIALTQVDSFQEQANALLDKIK